MDPELTTLIRGWYGSVLMYTGGELKGLGPRYLSSIEDKYGRFAW